MNGGEEGHPAWWLNLDAHPDAVVRLARQDPRPVRARVATGQEHDRLWQRWVVRGRGAGEAEDSRINEDPREVVVLRIVHRGEVYRPR